MGEDIFVVVNMTVDALALVMDEDSLVMDVAYRRVPP